MPGTQTNLRRGRITRMLAAFQSAKGTVVDDFSSGFNLWHERVAVDAKRRKSTPGPWMTQLQSEDTVSRYSLPENPEGDILAVATAESLEAMLRSNFGPLSAGTFSLKSSINEYLTLGWVENTGAGAVENFVRIQDAWFHTLQIIYDGARGMVMLLGSYAGRAVDVTALNSLGGITLPSSPMAPSDTKKFRVRSADLIREPSGVNVSLRDINIEIEIQQGLSSEWTMTDKWDVRKRGKATPIIRFRGNVSDETWALLTNARAGTKEHFRIVAASDGPSAKTLTVNLHEVDFEVEPLGVDSLEYVEFQGIGRAHVSGSDFVALSLA